MDTPYTLCTLPPDALRLIWERLTAHGEHHRKNLRLACRAIRATTTAFINSLTLDTSGAPATFEGVVSTAGHKLDAAPPGVGLTSLRWVVGGEGGVPRQAWPAALNTIFSRHGTLLASLTHLSLSVPPVSWKSRGEVAKAQCTRSTTQPNAPPPPPPALHAVVVGRGHCYLGRGMPSASHVRDRRELRHPGPPTLRHLHLPVRIGAAGRPWATAPGHCAAG